MDGGTFRNKNVVIQQLFMASLPQLGPCVHVAGGFVENQDGRIGQHRPGDGQQLLLSLAQVTAFGAEHGFVVMGQLAHEGVVVGQPGRSLHFLVGGVQPAVTDVFPAWTFPDCLGDRVE